MEENFNSQDLTNSQDLINELTNELAEQFLNSIEMLKKITLLTEKFYDGSHLRFVEAKSSLIAENLGIKDESLTELKIAAALHDIGKVSFNDSLLYKNVTEMESNELVIYQKHPEIGYYILKTNPHLDEVAKIVLQHHERNDGSGFPNNLNSDKIHPAAKIISVVNIYHNAIYKKRITANQGKTLLNYINTSTFLESTKERFNNVLNYLYNKRGSQFEKKVVELLIDIETEERRQMGDKTVLRLPINRLEPGMQVADDYFTSYGMLIAARGDILTEDSIRAMMRFVENEELPMKILVIN